MTKELAIVNGRILPLEEAVVSVTDLGFLRGMGAFDTLRTYGGHPHALSAHLERLWRTAASFGVPPLFTESEIRALLAEARARAALEEAWVNFVVTPGRHVSRVYDAKDPTWVVLVRRLVLPPPEAYERGVAVVTFSSRRHFPGLKTTQYLPGYAGFRLAEEAGAAEALYVDERGNVTEGITSNVTAVFGDTAVHPAEDHLPGLTQRRLKELSAPLGLAWEARSLTPEDLVRADEVWITSAIRELLPVVSVDGRPVGAGKPGRWARKLGPLYRADCLEQALRDAGGG